MLCYCGYIRDKEAVYIDFKKAANRQIALPERFVGKDFAIYESSEGVSCKWSETQGTISVVANEAGSCVIVFWNGTVDVVGAELIEVQPFFIKLLLVFDF